MAFVYRLNDYLDRLAERERRVFRLPLAGFRAAGCIGLVLAVLLAQMLVTVQGLPTWVMVVVSAAAVLTFLGLTLVTKLIVGEERIINYHHQIAVLAVAAGLLELLHQPVLPYLDATMLGVGVFIACGRLGCFTSGCCHGRPHGWGVCYGDEHAASGFPRYLVGVRLFPVQLAESLWVLGGVVVGVGLVFAGQPPGAALSWYLVAYAVGRFGFEFLRGDPDRPYWRGFSEAQWTSLLLTWVVAGAEIAGLLAFQAWHATAAVGLALGMGVIAIGRRSRGIRAQLSHPKHISELAAALEEVGAHGAGPAGVHIARTSLGVRLSGGRVPEGAGYQDHYTLSLESGGMTEPVAADLARLIARLRRVSEKPRAIGGRQGVFHLVLDP